MSIPRMLYFGVVKSWFVGSELYKDVLFLQGIDDERSTC
jgi:hypothetical protein